MSAKTDEIRIRKMTAKIRKIHDELKQELSGCEHYEYTAAELELYKDIVENCEDCDAPVLWSCCNDELDPSPEAGGFCPTCKEHNL